MADAILITGADGYLGRLLVRRLLAGTDRPLILWTRAADRAQAAARGAAAFGGSVSTCGRITWAGGDLRSAEPFAGIDRRQVSTIVHLAASTSFTVDAVTATAVNVEGTRRLLAFAATCPELASVCMAGTLYASGLTPGLVPERPIRRRPAFANEYERSKWEAEALLAGVTVPRVSTVRIATVIADDPSGDAGAHNAVHHTLQLLRLGLLSMMPGDPTTGVHVTTGQRAVEAIWAAAERGCGVYHAAEPAGHGLTLGRALQVACEIFAEDEGVARRRVRWPVFTDRTTFDLLADATTSLGGGVLGQAVGSVRPFAPQLYVDKRIGTGRLRALLPDRRPLDTVALFAATCRRLVDPGWARDGRTA